MRISNLLDPEFQAALSRLSELELSAKTAFKIQRNINEVQDALAGYEAARIKLVNELGDKDESGELITNNGNVKIIDHIEAFASAINDLMNSEVFLETIFAAELENAKISAKQIQSLCGLIQE